jgi:oligopeptide transport system substrate-binding protein
MLTLSPSGNAGPCLELHTPSSKVQNMNHRTLWFSVATLLLTVFWAPAQSAVQETLVKETPLQETPLMESAVHISNGGEPQTLDPHRYNLRLEETILTDLFLGLTAMNAHGEIVQGAAESWSTSADGLSWTFKIRKDLRWSDGAPLTAEDFVYSFRRLLDPATAASLAYFMYPLLNAREVNSGALPPSALGVSAPDPLTLILKLELPYPHLTERLLYPTGFAVPEQAIEEWGDAWVKAEHWVSNGAYRLSEWRPQSHVKLEPNPYFHEPGTITEVFYHPIANEQNAYNRYRAGEMDAIGAFPANELSHVRQAMPSHLRVSPLLSMIYLVFNTSRPPFDDPRVREALTIVVLPEVLTDKVQRTGNYPARSFVPALVDDYQSIPADFSARTPAASATRARQLLADAGYSDGLNVTLRYFDSADAKRTNLAIISFWKQIGVTASLHSSELKVHFSDLRQADFDVAQAGWVGENNAAHYLDLLVSDAGNVNYGRFENAEYDSMMALARTYPTIAERNALMEQAEAFVMTKYPVVPLWTTAIKRLVNPQLKGWHENNRDVHPARFLSW